MDKQSFIELLDSNASRDLRDNSIVYAKRSQYLPVSVDVIEEEDWKGNKRKVTQFTVQAFNIDNEGKIVLGKTRLFRPRDIEPSRRTLGEIADEVMDKRQTDNLYRELRDESPWSPNRNDFDNEYAYARQADKALADELRRAVREAGMVSTDSHVRALVADHVVISFTMTLAEAKALLMKQAVA
jgi:hypothetical protein